jgi:hypothetical protein
MAGDLDAMALALRVLTAVTEGAEPTAEDVAVLKRMAPGSPASALDDLAREVIERILKERAEGATD